jgi:hypothetical protein
MNPIAGMKPRRNLCGSAGATNREDSPALTVEIPYVSGQLIAGNNVADAYRRLTDSAFLPE